MLLYVARAPYCFEACVHLEKSGCRKQNVYTSVLGEGAKEHREGGEMKNKRKYNRNSKVELPKRYRKNKK